MNTFQLQLPEQLQSDINFLKLELAELKKNFQPKEPTTYLTRNEVSEMLHCDLSTVHNLTKRGVLKKFSIGGRVYYKRNQVESQIIELKS